MARICNYLDSESRLVVARAWGREEEVVADTSMSVSLMQMFHKEIMVMGEQP